MPFLHRPTTLAEAADLLSILDNAMVYGGGTAIQILVKQGILFADNFVDLGAVPGLRRHRRRRARRDRRADGDACAAWRPTSGCAPRRAAGRRGLPPGRQPAGAQHRERRRQPRARRLPARPADRAAGARRHGRGHLGARHPGDPGPRVLHRLPGDRARPGELVSAIRIPVQPAGSGHRFEKNSSLGENDWPCASAAVLVTGTEVHIGLGAVAPTPRHVWFDATGLDDQQAVDAALEVVEPALDPIPDVRGGVPYKRRLARVTVEDAVRAAWKEHRMAELTEGWVGGRRPRFDTAGRVRGLVSHVGDQPVGTGAHVAVHRGTRAARADRGRAHRGRAGPARRLRRGDRRRPAQAARRPAVHRPGVRRPARARARQGALRRRAGGRGARADLADRARRRGRGLRRVRGADPGARPRPTRSPAASFVHDELRPSAVFGDLRHLRGVRDTNVNYTYSLRHGDAEAARDVRRAHGAAASSGHRPPTTCRSSCRARSPGSTAAGWRC